MHFFRHPLRIHFGVREGVGDWHTVIRNRIDPLDFRPSYGPLKAATAEDCAAIVPLSLADQARIALNPSWQHKAILPSNDVVMLCDDKRRFDEALTPLGFSALRPGLPQISYPYVAKASHSCSGADTFIIRSREEKQGLRAFLQRKDVFYQRYLPDTREYAAHFLIRQGRVHFQTTVCHEMPGLHLVKGMASANGIPMRSRNIGQDPYRLEWTKLLLAIGYEGAACIDYKVIDGRPKIMELNPRLGFSLLRCVNVYLDAYLLALGLTQPRSASVQWWVNHRRNWSRRVRRYKHGSISDR